MKQELDEMFFSKFLQILPDTKDIQSAAIPQHLVVQGTMKLYAWVPDDEFLGRLRCWMTSNNQTTAYYFLMEGIEGDRMSFAFETLDLTEEALEDINPGYKSSITSPDFSWVISSDANKLFYIAGPKELFLHLK